MSKFDAMWQQAERAWEDYWRAVLANHWIPIRVLLYERYLRFWVACALQKDVEDGLLAEACEHCHGIGQVLWRTPEQAGGVGEETTCDWCGGRGLA